MAGPTRLISTNLDGTHDVAKLLEQRATEDLITATTDRVADEHRSRDTRAGGRLLQPVLQVRVKSEALRHATSVSHSVPAYYQTEASRQAIR